MKGIIIYDTSYGNTQKIAEVLSETLKDSGIENDVFHIKKIKKINGKDYNFLALGSPTKFGTMSFAMKFFLGKINSKDWANKPFFASDTENPENVEKSRVENKDWSAAEKIAEKLKEKNMNQLLPVLKGLVNGMKGPLLEGEIERTKNYALDMATKLRENLIH